MHSGGFEPTKPNIIRLEDDLIRHRGDRLVMSRAHWTPVELDVEEWKYQFTHAVFHDSSSSGDPYIPLSSHNKTKLSCQTATKQMKPSFHQYTSSDNCLVEIFSNFAPANTRFPTTAY